MSPLIIILGVVVVFLLYKLYVIYTSAPVSATNIYLGSDKVPPPVSSSMNNPNNSTYTIAFWIYINTYSQAIDEFLAFGNYGKTTSGGLIENSPQDVCTFSMDTSGKPTLYANINTMNSFQEIQITNNMPIQTWTYVAVSVSTNAGSYADCYINGKLVVSQQLTSPPVNPASMSGNSEYRNTFAFGKGDVYLNNISWIPNPIDPQTAWYYYNQGNGNPSGTGTMSSYHLEVEFTKDGNASVWKIF
jgi:hypothetical protein